MEQPEISVIAPCYNEEGNIDLLCKRIHQALLPLGKPFELVLVDDASVDLTKEKILEAEKGYDFVVGAFHQVNRGIVQGWRTGYETSKGRYLVTIDADLQYRPEDIASLYERITKGDSDMVQGWRRVQKQRSALRKTLTSGLSGLLNLVFKMNLKDNKSGFILYKRDVLGDVLNDDSMFYYFQHFVTIAAHAKGYRIVQLPVTFDQRYSGESFITKPFRFSLKAALDIPKAIWEYRIRKPGKRLEG